MIGHCLLRLGQAFLARKRRMRLLAAQWALQTHARGTHHTALKLVDRVRTLYRGSSLSDRDLAKLRAPQAMTVWTAFTSVSESHYVALRFMQSADVSEGQRRVLFGISSAFGCSMGPVSLFDGEAEVLLPAYSAFAVESVDDIDDPVLPHVRICLTHKADSNQIPVEAAGTGLVASGPAATGLTGSSEVSDAAEAADVLLRLFADQDVNADVEVMSTATGNRLWGRCWFSTSEIAAAAQRKLNGHVLGDHELSVRMAPVGTEGFGLRAKVRVMLTGVEHTGTVLVAARTLEQAQALKALASAEGRLVLGQGVAVRLGPCSPQKGAPADPLKFLVSNVPQAYTERMLQHELARLCPCLPPDAVKRLHRDKQKVEEEQRALGQQSVAEECERMMYVSSMAGAHVLDIQEEAGGRGAQFVLWMDSAEHASAVARRLDGERNRDLGMRVFAHADCAGEFVMRQDVHRALARVVDETVDGLNARMAQENANVCVRSCGPAKPHIFSITGDNARLMVQAYDELVRLQRGEMVSVLPRDRSKLFPPQRLAKEEATRVAGLLKELQAQHGCFIKAQYSTSTVHVAGRDVARAAVKQALQAYLRTVPYTTQLRVPPRHMGVIKAMLDGAQYPKVTYCTPTPALLKLESCDYDMLMEEVRPAITEHLAELAVEYATCYICMEETAVRLRTCGHRLCDDCGVQHVATEAANNAILVVCKALCGCNLSLLQEDLARLTSNVDDVYAAGLRSFMLQDAARARYTYCHTPDCPEILGIFVVGHHLHEAHKRGRERLVFMAARHVLRAEEQIQLLVECRVLQRVGGGSHQLRSAGGLQ